MTPTNGFGPSDLARHLGYARGYHKGCCRVSPPPLGTHLHTPPSCNRSEIRVAAHKVLMEFLVEIQVSRNVDWVALAAILVDKAGSQVCFSA